MFQKVRGFSGSKRYQSIYSVLFTLYETHGCVSAMIPSLLFFTMIIFFPFFFFFSVLLFFESKRFTYPPTSSSNVSAYPTYTYNSHDISRGI